MTRSQRCGLSAVAVAVSSLVVGTPTLAQVPPGAGPTASLTLDAALRAAVERGPLGSSVRDAYWDLVYTEHVVEAVRESLSLAGTLLLDHSIRVQLGTLPPADLATARNEQADRSRELMMAENGRRVAELTLKRLIVNGPDDPYWMATLDTVDRGRFEPDPTDLAEAINRASGVIESEGSTGVTAAALNVREMAQSVRAAQIAQELSLQRLDLEQRSFEAGNSTSERVVQTQRGLREARLAALRASLNYRKALIEFDRLRSY